MHTPQGWVKILFVDGRVNDCGQLSHEDRQALDAEVVAGRAMKRAHELGCLCGGCIADQGNVWPGRWIWFALHNKRQQDATGKGFRLCSFHTTTNS